MTKNELIKTITEATEFKRSEVERVVSAVFTTMTEKLAAGEQVKITGFGTFEARNTAPRQARNPKSGAAVHLPASRKPTFKASNILKDIMKQT